MAARMFIFLALHALVLPALADIRLPRLVSNGMVLQRGEELTIWGWADPGERVTVTLAGETGKAVTAPDGKWGTVLPAIGAGGPYTLTVKGKNTVVIDDVLIGDVWLCSGQSNMVHMLDIHDVTYEKEIAEADFPQIRQFLVPTATDLVWPQADVRGGRWEEAVREKVRDFSVVAYFFALQIHKTQGVPIGIINASVGGTPIEAWTSEAGLRRFPDVINTVRQNKDTAYVHATNRSAALANKPAPFDDRGITSEPEWFDTNYMPSRGWRTINVPGYWEDQGVRDLNGIVWYRKEVKIPAAMVGKPARIFLGRIVDADELYINGKKIGNTTYMYPQRRYHIAADVLKAGTNVFVVKVTNHQGKGGFVPDKPYCIFAGADTVDLKGTWHYRVGAVFASTAHQDKIPTITIQNQPTALFNAMVAPIVDYAIKGVLWYQGESNVARPDLYASRMRALIADWRKQWGKEQLPFLYVQLPGFMEYDYLPSESSWAELREAQRETLSVPHTGMAVAIDLGEWNDIHPERKKEIGDRLARLARGMVYKQDIVAHGPMYRAYRKEGNRIILSFDGVGSGLETVDGGPLAEFAVAGPDGEFRWARAEIVNGEVAVWNDDVP
ncbi:sialate O-acetylesterase [Parapedobacter soli]|uniref:sialate O-acetylesterase n=1 Tax=Parapedobacter soli TaxID=416955 RepID=UPI0021C57DAA|nr:sialate O-acetylesterase [Parapedobacter soli]